MAVQLLNLRTVAGKLETTAGTAETVANSDFDVRIEQGSINLTLDIQMDSENAKYATGDHGGRLALSGQQMATLAFTVPLVYSGTAATEANQAKLWNACGLKPVTYTTTGIGYCARKDYDIKPITFWVQDTEAGASAVTTTYKIAGAMGNMVIGADAVGGPVMCQYTFTGKLTDIVDGTKLELTSQDTANGERWLSSTCTIGGTARQFGAWSLDLGNTISMVDKQGDATGIEYFGIESRNPKLTLNPYAIKQATVDELNLQLTMTPQVISIATANFTVKAVAAQLYTNQLGNRNGRVTWEQVYHLTRNGNYSPNPDADLEEEDTFEILQKARA